jgi:hypothetical protein
MNRLLIGSTAILFGMCGALGWGLYNQIQTNGKLRANLATVTNELKAERLAAKLDNQEALENYQAASNACQRAIKAAVAAVQLKPIEVPRYDETGAPNPACPAISLSDIQAAGGDANVSAVPQSGSATRTESPR